VKKFFKKEKKYSFFDPRNILLGLIWAVLAILTFFALIEIDYYIHYTNELTDLSRPASSYVFWVSFLIFILPIIIFYKKLGKKNILSVLISEIFFLALIILFLIVI